MCRSILKQTIKKRRFICRLSNTLAIFATNRFACGFHHRRLKGNRVQILDSPAAVRFHVKHFNVHPLPLIIFRYIREKSGRRFEMETESEYLPFIVFLCYSWDRAKRSITNYQKRVNMGKVFPPFKIDIAGALCVPSALRGARSRYRDGQISLQTLRAVEDAEIRNLTERLKSAGMKVATDGGFRSYDFLEGWEGIRRKTNTALSSGGELEVTGRIGLLHHPIIDDFVFLVENSTEEVLPKQHMPSPGKLLMRILRETESGCLKSVYPDLNVLLDDLAAAYKKLLEGLYRAGCRYVQFEGVKAMLTDEAARLNNRVLRERPEGLFVAFHAATDMLVRLQGADAYFLNYDCGICDRSRLLWFVREREAVFGFVLSYYPDEDELDELQAKIEEVLNYIPAKRLTLCLPDAAGMLGSSDADETRQWKAVELAKDMADRVFPV